MIAIVTSSLIAYLSAAEGLDVEATGVALEHRLAALPPVVLSELLSDPPLSREVRDLFGRLPLLEVTDGYWERAGLLRARVLAQRRRARLADTLIAQSCLDHDVELVTRDADFRPFVRAGGLRLFPLRAHRQCRASQIRLSFPWTSVPIWAVTRLSSPRCRPRRATGSMGHAAFHAEGHRHGVSVP